MDLRRFRERPLMGILRGISAEAVAPVVAAAARGGLGAIEITMNTPGAGDLIARTVQAAGGEMAVGAGTVLDMPSLTTALAAGATFIVMPIVVEPVMAHCRERAIPVFPGALTPTEIHRAHALGATMVKVFPAGAFGPRYFKEVRGPFDAIELLACGGVTPENLRDYRAHGASAAAFGASVFKKEWIASGAVDRIESAVRAFVEAL